MGNLIDTYSIASPVVLSTMSFDPALLESIVLVLLRDGQTPTVPRDRATLMESTMSVENQKKLED